MIDSILFSKDRACQLDGCVRSIRENLPFVQRVVVVYVASNQEFQAGYDKLDTSLMELVQETDIRSDWFYNISRLSDLVYLSTDDTFVFRRAPESPEWHANWLAFSCRLGLNTTLQNYSTGQHQPPLTHYEYHTENQIQWPWVQRRPTENYGYASAMDATIYSRDTLLEISQFEWNTLRGWEGTLAVDRRTILGKWPMMASYTHSVAVNLPTNNIQPDLYAGTKYPVDPQTLNQKFLDGEYIDIHKMDFSNIIGAHQEIELCFSRR